MMLKILTILLLLTGISNAQEKKSKDLGLSCGKWVYMEDNELTHQHSLAKDGLYMNPYGIKACISDSFGACSPLGTYLTISIANYSKIYYANFSSKVGGLGYYDLTPGEKYTTKIVAYQSLEDIKKGKPIVGDVFVQVCLY